MDTYTEEAMFEEIQLKKKNAIMPRWVAGRLLYAFVTIATPAFGFVMAQDNIWGPDWQYGFRAYVELLLQNEINIYFVPFLLYGVVSMTLMLIAPNRFAPRLWVRFGIYTGTFLVVHYIILMLMTGMLLVALAMGVPALIGLFLLYKGYRFAERKWGKQVVVSGTAVFLLIGSLLAISFDFWDSLILSPLLAIWMAGFVLILPMTLHLSWKLWRTYEMPETWSNSFKFGSGIWLGGYLFQWVNALGRMQILYNELPTAAPDCYIATAAANGHASVVGSQQMGQVMVNRQLQTLKAAEMLLMVLFPQAHRWVRRVYDVYGRQLAQKLTHPLLADLAYLTLKPFEWGSRLLLWLVVPNSGRWIGRFYNNS